MLRGCQPPPQLRGDRDQIAAPAGPDAIQQLELVLARPGEQRLHELGLAAEQEQQDARTRPHGRGQRPQRQIAGAVLEHVLVGQLEQLRRRGEVAGGLAGIARSSVGY